MAYTTEQIPIHMTTNGHVFTYDEWQSRTRKQGSFDHFIFAMQSGKTFEVDEEMFYYWLEVLPSVHMGRRVILPNGECVSASFGFAEGAEPITVFWQHRYGRDLHFFGCRTDRINQSH